MRISPQRLLMVKRAAVVEALRSVGLPDAPTVDPATDPNMEAVRTRSGVDEAFTRNETADRAVPSRMAEPAVMQEHAP